MTYFVATITTNYISATTPLPSVRAPEDIHSPMLSVPPPKGRMGLRLGGG